MYPGVATEQQLLITYIIINYIKKIQLTILFILIINSKVSLTKIHQNDVRVLNYIE